MNNVDFIRAETKNQVLQLLADNSKNTRILAGGTDVLTGIRMKSKRFADIDTLLDINSLNDLKGIRLSDNSITVGGNVTFSEILQSQIIHEKLPLLVQSASGIGNLQIRNRATIVGNFVNNAPCADSVPALLVYNAKLRIESLKGVREIALQDFLVRAYKTQIAADELVTEIQIPLANDFCGYFYKLGRRQSVAISRISLAVLAKLDQQKIDEIRIAGGAVTPIGKRFKELEDFARGKIANKELFTELSQKIAQQTLDITGLRWSSYHKIPVLQQTFYQLLVKTTMAEDVSLRST